MKQLKKLLWCILLICSVQVQATSWNVSEWTLEDSSGKARVSVENGIMDILSPDGLTLWFNERITGNYEISYRIRVVMNNGKYDRLSDMNCFWGANDPENPDNIFAKSKQRKGLFRNYNHLNLFYVGYGGNENKTTRFRKYHGEFYGKDENKIKPLLKEYTQMPYLLEANRWYDIVISVHNDSTTFIRDGEVLFTHVLKDKEGDGHFAIRLWKNHVQLSDFTIRTGEQEFAYQNFRRYYREALAYRPAEKTGALAQLRTHFSKTPFRVDKHFKPESAEKYLSLLTEEGTFSDLDATERRFEQENRYQQGYLNTTDDEVGIFIGHALTRLYYIGDAYRKGKLSQEQATDERVWKAMVHYGNIEISRPNNKPRFHASCFAIPAAAANTYFTFLKEMEEAEQGKGSDAQRNACEMLKVLGLQAYTQPLRNDDTDRDVVSVERFRNHVWWVGGNALAYRPLLPVAAMFSSIEMIDLLAEVAQRGISMTSQLTYDDAFWTEGFTADGAGWGHGKQCLIWGYPIDGTFSALNMLGMLKGTPWAKKLSADNVKALMNFMRGGSWYYYKGFRLPGLDRNSYVYNPSETAIPYLKMLNLILKDWSTSFSEEELKELKQLQAEAKQKRINMEGYEKGVYSGTRWFFNNDDLMKKTPDYHLCINMASYRTDGLESAAFADNYNFCPTDGATLFQRSGDEYFRIMGGWDVTAIPGVTAREGMDKLKPVTNWRGYCSRYNYAAGATNGGENAVAGYIFDKMHGGEKEAGKKGLEEENPVLYGVKAYKGYFILGDYMAALGAGIHNRHPQMEGSIRTTIDQTAWVAPVSVDKSKGSTIVAENNEMEVVVEGKKLQWITQKGKFSYAGIPGYCEKVHVVCENLPAMWKKFNPANAKKKDLPQSLPALRVWIDHGQSPVNASYGYVVYTGNESPEDKPAFEVLRNDTLIQAVRSADKTVLEAVFYTEQQELKGKGYQLKVSAPCAVLIEKEKEHLQITVADAQMNADLTQITVSFNGKDYEIPLPQGMECGKPGTLSVKE